MLQTSYRICSAYTETPSGVDRIFIIRSYRYPCQALVLSQPSCNPTSIKCATHHQNPASSVKNSHPHQYCRKQCMLTLSGKGWLSRVYTFACFGRSSLHATQMYCTRDHAFFHQWKSQFPTHELINHIILGPRWLINHKSLRCSLMV